MDEILQRIISLMPLKESGKPKHGAKKEFADSIGVPQQRISDWLGGRSDTYMNMLYEIAEAHNVSVTWLKTGKYEEEVIQELNDRVEEKKALSKQKQQSYSDTLTPKEKELLSYFSMLNEKGQDQAISQLLALTYVPDYQQDTDSAAVS